MKTVKEIKQFFKNVHKANVHLIKAYVILEKFCEYNNFKLPNVVITRDDLIKGGLYVFDTDTIYINLDYYTSPGFQWSYIATPNDSTILGILAHELGHYIDDKFKLLSKKYFTVKYLNGEPPVSRYEESCRYFKTSERFAEAIKLFILNPNLLRVGRPLRYQIITKIFELKPIFECDNWKKIIQLFNPNRNNIDNIFNYCERWIENESNQ